MLVKLAVLAVLVWVVAIVVRRRKAGQVVTTGSVIADAKTEVSAAVDAVKTEVSKK